MRRRGTILLAVLVITALASMVAASILFQLRADIGAARAGHSRQQAYAVALAGVQRAVSILRTGYNDMELWYDNPGLFGEQLVLTDGGETWYFTIYAHNPDDPTAVRYGLTDEAGKINLNTASEQALAALPNMTSDGDSDERSEGAEQEYYSRLPVPYLIKNGLLATMEELLLVKGFSGSIVYGEDHNLNGTIETNEDDGDDSFPPDNRDGELDGGLMRLATVVSYEFHVDGAGKARVNINGEDQELEQLDGAGLPRETVDFIRQYRQAGQTFKHPSELLNMEYQTTGQQSAPRGRGRGRRGGGGQQQTVIRSGVNAGNLSVVLDKLTTQAGGANTPIVGLINVNTAPAKVLSLVPGIDQYLAEEIVEARGDLEAQEGATIAWLVSRNVVAEEKFKEIAPHLTARSYQFRVRCVGFAVPSGRFYVLEAIIDLAAGEPRIVYMRDLTRLGMPVAVDLEQLQGL